MKSDSASSIAETVCVPMLRGAQNEDGGWGFRPGTQSRVEATCWAVKALSGLARKTGGDSADVERIERGLKFLTAAQLGLGAWAAMTGEPSGSWVTSLACWTLAGVNTQKYSNAISTGLRWVCDDWPKDSSWLQKTLRILSSRRKLAKQNDTYRGWGWTPGTSSWVEPSSFAMLALEHAGAVGLADVAEKRRALGEVLLYDRMVAGGGWNCGNPEVYGVAGEPLVIPTMWALLALRRHAERRENVESIAWMEKNFSRIQGPGSLALARICLAVYGRGVSEGALGAGDLHAKNESLNSVQVAAWTIMAESGVENLFNAVGGAR